MKILALTSIRSDYDLLSSLYKILNDDKEIELKLLVSGAHLSNQYGNTKELIKSDGLEILLEVETLINSDTPKSKLKTASIFLQNSIDVVDGFSPDLILFAGDREDVIMGGLLGVYLQIPTIHFYGGDHETAGHEDTVIRHATSKLATLHFVSCDEHKQRLEKMGEESRRIHNIGSISLDRLRNFNFMSLELIKKELDITLHNKIALVIYHPSPNKNESDDIVFRNILESLRLNDFFAIVSYPNTDSNHSKILDVIKEFETDENIYFFKNLHRDIFLSIFTQSTLMIGNSSAGIYEAASIPIPAINVGMRQKDRMANENVLFCNTDVTSITESIQKVCSKEFSTSMQTINNIYGDGKSALRAYNLIKTLNIEPLKQKIKDPLCI